MQGRFPTLHGGVAYVSPTTAVRAEGWDSPSASESCPFLASPLRASLLCSPRISFPTEVPAWPTPPPSFNAISTANEGVCTRTQLFSARRRSVPRGPVATQPSRPSSGERGGTTRPDGGISIYNPLGYKNGRAHAHMAQEGQTPGTATRARSGPVPQYTCTVYSVQSALSHSAQYCMQRQ